jgi:hypothetical protein
MQRLLALTIGLCFSFSIFAVAAILIGRQQPPPEHLAMLHLTDCDAPCWIGIMPGESSVEQARARIAAVYAKSGHYSVFQNLADSTPKIDVIDPSTKQPILSIWLYLFQTYKVEAIELEFKPGNGSSFGDLYAILGTPTKLTLRLVDIITGRNAYQVAFHNGYCVIAAAMYRLTIIFIWLRPLTR